MTHELLAWIGHIDTPPFDPALAVAVPSPDGPEFELTTQTQLRKELSAAVPGLADWFTDVATQLAQHRAVVVSGFPVTIDAVLLGLAASVGHITATGNGWPPRLIYEIKPDADLEPSYTPSLASTEFAPHTDSVLDSDPHRVVMLACVRSSSNGGQSAAVAVEAVLAELDEADRKILRDPVPWANPLLPGHAPDIRWFPVVDEVDGQTRVRWRADMFRNGLDQTSMTEQPAHGRFEETVTRLCAQSRFMLNAGDVLILDNWSTIHGRAAIGSADRHLRRLKLY